ncbi:MAG: hypothetical protein M0P27_09355, partial [Bacteroidales bacterium]|nr:hypothetical protein [Bacteroidales bacterium]
CSEESNKMKINIISPSGERYTDAFLFPSPGKNSSPPIPKDRFKVVKSGIWRDAGWVYKRGIRFPVPGKWYFNVYTENDDPRCVRELFLTVR